MHLMWCSPHGQATCKLLTVTDRTVVQPSSLYAGAVANTWLLYYWQLFFTERKLIWSKSSCRAICYPLAMQTLSHPMCNWDGTYMLMSRQLWTVGSCNDLHMHPSCIQVYVSIIALRQMDIIDWHSMLLISPWSVQQLLLSLMSQGSGKVGI